MLLTLYKNRKSTVNTSFIIIEGTLYIMKLFQPKVVCCLTLLTLGTTAYSNSHSEWIYGASKAQNFHGTGTKEYYVSIGTYKNKHYAQKEYRSLKAKHVNSVHMSSKGSYYNVFIGPLHSADSVRAVGSKLTHKHSAILAEQPTVEIDDTAQPLLTKEPLNTSMTMSTSYSRVVTLSLGASWTQSHHSVTETLAPEIVNTYTANNNGDAFAVGEIFAGMERELSPGWLGQLGVAVAGGGNTDRSGDIWANADPDFDNFTYNYSINRVYVGLKGKVLADVASIGIQPYVSGSLGLGFNHAFGYASVAKIPEEVADQPFGSNVTTSFAYTVGAGIQKTFTPNWAIGVGYEFSDWGKSSLASIPGVTQSNSLVLDHLYNNAVLVNLSYHG